MSIINQVLLDLDKRHASGVDRNGLPDHVRALPEAREDSKKWMIAITGLAVAAVVVWAMMSGFAFQPGKKPPPAVAEVHPAAGAKIIKAAAKPESIPDIQPRDESAATPGPDSEILPFGRLSLELSNPPATIPENAQQQSEPRIETRAPIATARVVGKPRPDPGKPTAPEAAAPMVVASIAAPGRQTGPSADPEPATQARAVTRPRQPARLAQATPPEIQKNAAKLTPLQLAEQEYAKASTFLHQGKRDEARAALLAALKHYPAHMGVRQGLFGMMMEDKKYAEAEQIMMEGLQLNPAQIGFAMALARLQLDRGNTQAAVDTLNTSLTYAHNNPDYLAFLAALLQRQNRHAEAIDQYIEALKLQPKAGVWLMGLGISLQAVKRNPEAQEAFSRAKASGNLSPSLQAYVDQQLRQMK